MNLTPSCGGSFESKLDFNQGRIEGRASAQIGKPSGGEDIDVDAAGKLGPPQLGANHTGRYRAVHARREKDLPALVKHAYTVAVTNAADFGVIAAYVELVLGFHFLHAGQVNESAIEEVVGLASQ